MSNIKTFIENYNTEIETPKELEKLLSFTKQSKIDRKIRRQISYKNLITKGKNSYFFHYNGKKIPFSIFSEQNLQPIDKKRLESDERNIEYLNRTLKLACSLDLVNPRVVIGNSLIGLLDTIIIHDKNGQEEVINYSTNLVMPKADYYKLFEFEELNTLDKFDLYNLYYIFDKFRDFSNLYEYLLFTKEIFQDLSRSKDFYFLKDKYNKNGVNIRNYTLIGNNSDVLYNQKEDIEHNKNSDLINELRDFTEDPSIKTKHIKKKKDTYKLRKGIHHITFDLLSDRCKNEKMIKKLLSDNRYGECHKNAHIVARGLSYKNNKDSIYIVGGKAKRNEIDYYRHSWVEVDDKDVVVDFNNNIIMKKADYYKLFEAYPISRTKLSDMEDIAHTVTSADLHLHPASLNYLGKEIRRDLEKNAKIFTKK